MCFFTGNASRNWRLFIAMCVYWRLLGIHEDSWGVAAITLKNGDIPWHVPKVKSKSIFSSRLRGSEANASMIV